MSKSAKVKQEKPPQEEDKELAEWAKKLVSSSKPTGSAAGTQQNSNVPLAPIFTQQSAVDPIPLHSG